MSIQEIYQLYLNSRGVSTDSRSIEPDQLFFALSGENFDGNQFAVKAIENGASFAVIDDEFYLEKDNTKYILVDNVLESLQLLANYHRKQLKIPVLGLTGSNGKTTTKELIHAILKQRYFVGSTKGNLNNHIGVPLTLLRFSYDTEIAIVEMGANHIGEIKTLCEIAEPNYGLITNIGAAHLEGFGSLEGVAKGKTELYRFIKEAKGQIFINGEDNVLAEKSMDLEEKIPYGKVAESLVSGEILSNEDGLVIELTINGQNYLVQTKLVGEYNLSNIVSAACVGLHFKIDPASVVKALESYEPNNNRSQVVEWNDNTVILDAYNANPTSMKAALESFYKAGYKKTMVILGEMKELGRNANQEHLNVYQIAKEYEFDDILLVGSAFGRIAESEGEQYFEDVSALQDWFIMNDVSDYHILIKGSRSNSLEVLIPKE